MLTKQQAWWSIAMAYQRRASTGATTNLSENGLCLAVEKLRLESRIDLDTYLAMSREIAQTLVEKATHDGTDSKSTFWLFRDYDPEFSDPQAQAAIRAIVAVSLAEYD
jgi:hypothetical protein